jgi:hypothetical protein
MSGKIKILALICVAALAVLLAGIPSGSSAGDLCCGNYVGKPLRAVFSNSYKYKDSGPTYYSNIFNDVPGYYYQCLAPGDSCVYLFRGGHAGIWVTKADSGRYVQMLFDGEKETPTDASCALNAYFIDATGINEARAAGFMFRTTAGYTESSNEAGELVLMSMGANLVLGNMVPGQTAYCNTWIEFSVADDPTTPSCRDPKTGIDKCNEAQDTYHIDGSPVKVSCESVGGKRRWVIRPIHEPFWIYTPVKIKKTITWNKSYSAVGTEWRDIWSDGHSVTCHHGKFYFPFELIFEEL